jgi:hypothetical protein
MDHPLRHFCVNVASSFFESLLITASRNDHSSLGVLKAFCAQD